MRLRQQIVVCVRFTLDYVNANGTFLGRQLQLIVDDEDEGSPTKGVTAARKLIERDLAPVIIGTYVSAVAQAPRRIARKAKVPMLSGGSTTVSVTNENTAGDPWFFRAWPSSAKQGEQTAKDIVQKLGKRRVSIIDDNSNYRVTLRDQVSSRAKEIGGEIISVDSYNTWRTGSFVAPDPAAHVEAGCGLHRRMAGRWQKHCPQVRRSRSL